MNPTATEPRGMITTHDPARPGNGTSRMWTRIIRGKLYSFTAVIMPSGERRYFANRFDGTDPRFHCEWTHDVLTWTIPANRRPTEMDEPAADPPPEPDPAELLGRLGARTSPDLDAYASGRLPAHMIRCLMCGHAPCRCEALGLTFGSAAYFARLDAMHGVTRTPAEAATCSAPECPMTARVGEHPAGIAVAGTGVPTIACMIDVRPPAPGRKTGDQGR